ncbi:MAG: alkaline shock response membrane anchor protein AmaP [Syntrophomonadaceae bacterium]|nr:alkaline shock response membrane anchor protein AmaP [Syntrophomonadaceae bacterium]
MAEELGNMKLRSRLIILLFSLLLIGLGGVVAALALGWRLPLDQLMYALNILEGRWLLGLVGTILVLIGLLVFFDGLKPAPSTEGVIQELQLGRVVTTNQALESVVHKAVRQIRGVREVKPLIRVDTAGLTVLLRVVLSPEVKVPEIAQQIQESVRAQIRETIGAEVLEVRIKVDNIGFDPVARVE